MTRRSQNKPPASDGPTIAGRPSVRSRLTSTPPASEVRALTRGLEPSDSEALPAGTGSLLPTAQSTAGDAALAEVLAAEEATRAHGFSAIITLLAVGVACSLPFLRGDPGHKAACAAALALIAAVSAWVWYITRAERADYTRAAHRIYGWTLVFSVLLVESYVGFFSPVPVVLTLGIYYLGQSSDRFHSFAMPIAAIASYAILALLIAFGVLEDRGLFNAVEVDLASRLFAVTAASSVLSVTLFMARVSRGSMREAIARSNELLLVAQQREAQLAEAHHQLDRALRVAIGKPGRYTGEVAGDFRLGLVVGIGAIGEVYGAEHTSTGQKAAVKLLQVDAMAREDLVERFMREAEISGRLDDPNIVKVYDVGRLEDGAPYLAMELLEGRDLAARLRQEGQLSLREVARLAEQLGAALTHAHGAGVVHRDLKPLNVFETTVDERPHWKILDFGISKLSSSSGTLTQEAVVGTPGYMSPEQARGAEVDHRSDVFSMAVVLYRALTGQPAFPGDNTPQILFDIVYKNPARPSAVGKRVPREVDSVMAVGLAKEPQLRFQSAKEFAAAFAAACRRELSEPLRARAENVARRYPWGSSLGLVAPPVAPDGD